MLIRCVSPIHPDTNDKWYSIELPVGRFAEDTVTTASWSAVTGSKVILGTSASISNPGDVAHPDGYDGPVLSVQLSGATGAAEGDSADITCEYSTDRPEGPLHLVLRVGVSTEGY